MKVYVASHSQESAREIAKKLLDAGHEIQCCWLDKSFQRTARYTLYEKQRIAIIDLEDIVACDVLVLEGGWELYPGGKFVEAGYALGLGKQVVVIGRVENMMLYHPTILAFDTIEEFIEAFK